MISFNAHKHRINIECYDVYASIEKRTEFARELRSNIHGTSINEASLLMHYNETPIGLIEVVHTKHVELNMGWIMDIALLPEYQGMGLGKYLIKNSMNQLYNIGYTAAGLGVTLTNKNAHETYKSLGFEDYEVFIEIIGV
jgi:ribosomal protein S18 acetylase RimI-like enzyme